MAIRFHVDLILNFENTETLTSSVNLFKEKLEFISQACETLYMHKKLTLKIFT